VASFRLLCYQKKAVFGLLAPFGEPGKSTTFNPRIYVAEVVIAHTEH